MLKGVVVTWDIDGYLSVGVATTKTQRLKRFRCPRKNVYGFKLELVLRPGDLVGFPILRQLPVHIRTVTSFNSC